jgi:hypothetical protein
MNKKMSFAELKAKASAVTTMEALNAIKGGEAVVCHDGKCFDYKNLEFDIIKLKCC